MDLFEIGVITKPQGLKGEFRVKLWSEDYNVFNNINYVYIRSEKYKVERHTDRNGFIVLKLKGINAINEVENIINSNVYVFKDDIRLEEDEFLIQDLITFDVFNDKKQQLGKLTDINKYGAADIFTVKNINEEFMFPYINDVVKEIDLENKKIIIKQDVLDEIKVD